ncbi:MAG: alanine--tRNA ligase [Candidatus Gastranaerophilales bacterium]|nr:alanine--tRNA ligase [Candidatus Gastranaerophilales bacterium]
MTANLTGSDIRKKFIEFFVEKHGHKQVESSSLIPDNPTVMLTTAGMLQFVPIFLGYKQPPNPPRATSVQKCARAGGKDSDIENVGRTPRHHTFFEMLGNFSFGDYFKEEIIPWSWDFVTNVLKLDESRLWITVFETDDEAYNIWHNKVGVPKDRIIRKGKKDNFWGPPGPTGPCGPCSEIHYDLGEEYSCGIENCGIDTCECDRFVEIWNLVFMELNQDEEGNLTPLEKKNVDTGMGLERITMVVNGKSSTFETDLLMPILEKVSKMSGKNYKTDDKTDISLRIVTDHARCVSFLISDGLVPGNEGRNYVLRMILRRALRHGRLLGLELPFLHEIAQTVIENYKEAYPDLEKNKSKILDVIKKEEERFNQTLTKGEALLDEIIKSSKDKISGENAFKLYDTFGFPLELTVEMAQEQGLQVDVESFNEEMKKQKERAKAAHVTANLTDNLVYADTFNEIGSTEFLGYSQTSCDNCTIKALIKDNERVEEALDGQEVDIVLDKTPFYAESGGQVSDTGIMENDDFKAEVVNTLKYESLFIHRCKILTGTATVNQTVKAIVDAKRRENITIHHSTAHLLQSALRKVVGDSVAQAGSQVEPNRTRFDFSFDRALTAEEVNKVEIIINGWISEGLNSHTEEMTIEEAQKSGAIALFDEKYGDKVRVVSIGEISKELCGGTHINSTSQIRLCKVISESAISSGTRRIELICGDTALEFLNQKADNFDKVAKMLKTQQTEVFNKIEKTMDELKTTQKRIKDLESEIAKGQIDKLLDDVVDIKNGKLLIASLKGITPDVLKSSVENLSDKLGDSIVLLASEFDGKVSIIAKVSQNFIDKGANAGQIVNEVALMCDGKGGGRPNMAQAGAKSPEKLDSAIEKFKKDLKEKF